MTTKTRVRDPRTGWILVWEGDASVAEAAEEVLTHNGLRFESEKVGEVRLYVPAEDAETARQLLKDRGG